MGHHPVGGAKLGRFGLVVAHQQLTDFDESKMLPVEGMEQFFDLVEGGHEVAEKAARLEGLADLGHIIPRIGQVQEKSIHIGLGEALSNIAQFKLDPLFQAKAGQVLAGQVLEFLPPFIGDDVTFRSDSEGQGHRHGAGAGAGFHDRLAGTDGHAGEDKADILGIHDLGAAFEILEQIPQGGLQHEEWAAHMAEYLAAPGFADQLIMVENAAMGVEKATGEEGKDEVFMTKPDEQGQVARGWRGRSGGSRAWTCYAEGKKIYRQVGKSAKKRTQSLF